LPAGGACRDPAVTVVATRANPVGRTEHTDRATIAAFVRAALDGTAVTVPYTHGGYGAVVPLAPVERLVAIEALLREIAAAEPMCPDCAGDMECFYCLSHGEHKEWCESLRAKRLVTALCVEQSDEWLSGRRYLEVR
jgi:hypothetical protein